jgi:hypothetical protein
MSDFRVTKFVGPQSSGRPPDLQVHLYKKIGISALVAALEVVTNSTASMTGKTAEERPNLPAILQSDDLAA